MENKKHSVTMSGRTVLNVTAVDDVISFDENLVSLAVGETVLNISGEELSVKNLSLENGDITVEGRIDAVVYSENVPRKGLFSFFGRNNG